MKVSVITVCFNSANTIKETIVSVNNQSYKNIEHIFVDGLSKDDTLEIINSYSKTDHSLISEKDKGIYDAMNKGILKSDGDIIMILNSDDILYSNNTISSIVDVFKKSNTEMVYGNMYISEEKNIRSYVRDWKMKKFKPGSFIKGWHPPHPALIVKKDVYNKYGLFDLNLRIAADFELMYRFFEVFKCNSKYHDEYITVMRKGGDSTNIKGIIKGNSDIRKAFNKHKVKLPFSYFFIRYTNKILQKLIS